MQDRSINATIVMLAALFLSGCVSSATTPAPTNSSIDPSRPAADLMVQIRLWERDELLASTWPGENGSLEVLSPLVAVDGEVPLRNGTLPPALQRLGVGQGTSEPGSTWTGHERFVADKDPVDFVGRRSFDRHGSIGREAATSMFGPVTNGSRFRYAAILPLTVTYADKERVDFVFDEPNGTSFVIPVTSGLMLKTVPDGPNSLVAELSVEGDTFEVAEPCLVLNPDYVPPGHYVVVSRGDPWHTIRYENAIDKLLDGRDVRTEITVIRTIPVQEDSILEV